MQKLIFTCLAIVAFTSCDKKMNPQILVDEAITKHGGNKFEGRKIEFDFRDRHYKVSRKEGLVTYVREFNDDSLGFVQDFLVNSSQFKRFVNDQEINLSEEWQGRYGSSVNSVLYFFQLPYGLNDPAVNKKYLGNTIINKQVYHKVRVTFDQEGGGEDYQDIFVYWINADEKTVDFLGYSYATDGGGTRFRQAINRRTIDGMIFQDYVNFKAAKKDLPIEDHDKYFEKGLLEELSLIQNENIIVAKI